MVIAALTAALIIVTSIGAYLWVTTNSWQDRSAQWESASRDLGDDVARLDEELDGANAELESARSQLETAQKRITELANEKAQLGDKNVASLKYLDYQHRVSQAAGNVAAALGECTTAQSELIGYLNNRESYKASEIDKFATQVNQLCTAAAEANTQLQRELAK